MKSYRNYIPFLISTVLHLTVLLAVSLATLTTENQGDGEYSEGGNGRAESNAPIVPKTVEVTLTESVTLTQEESPVEVQKAEKPVKGLPDCIGDRWYGGIGIYESKGLITGIVVGYPAEKAGLQKGDIIQFPKSDQIRGPVGTAILLLVMKQPYYQTMTITLIREKICEGG